MVEIREQDLVIYACEGCGCVHEDRDEVFSLNGLEMCDDCVDCHCIENDPDLGPCASPIL